MKLFDSAPNSSAMHLEGNIEVLKNLFAKKELLKKKKPHNQIRPLLIILGGGLRGVYGGGATKAMEDAGLTHVFDDIVGLSVGAPAGAYFLAGQSEKGASIIYQECVDHPFFSIARVFPGGDPTVDIDYVLDVYRGVEGKKGVSTKKVIKSRTNLWFIASTYLTGEQTFINAKECKPDIFHGIKISIDLPLLYHKNIIHQGKKYVDGGISNTFPVREIIKTFKPTDVLVLPNISAEEVMNEGNIYDWLYDKALALSLPKKLTTKMSQSFQERITSLRWLRGGGAKKVRWLIVWPDNNLFQFTQKAALLKKAFIKNAKFMAKALEMAKS